VKIIITKYRELQYRTQEGIIGFGKITSNRYITVKYIKKH